MKRIKWNRKKVSTTIYYAYIAVRNTSKGHWVNTTFIGTILYKPSWWHDIKKPDPIILDNVKKADHVRGS